MSSVDQQDESSKATGSRISGSLKSLRLAVRDIASWASENRLKACALVGVCVLSISAAVVSYAILAPQETGVSAGGNLNDALELLDAGEYGKALSLAKAIKDSGSLQPEDFGGPLFVIGAANCYEADHTHGRSRSVNCKLAARYLEEARDRGFPVGRRAEGLYLLGKCLCESGQFAASRSVLRRALKINKNKKAISDMHWLLAIACLKDAVPKYKEALEQNDKFLANRVLLPNMRHEGLVQRATILLRMGKTAECQSALDKLPADAKNLSKAIVLRAELLMLEAKHLKDEHDTSGMNLLESRRKYQAAIRVLREAQGHDTFKSLATGKARYLIGVCFLEIGDYRAALSQFALTRKLHNETPEAFAADFQEAQLARQLGRDKDALAAYRRVLNAITDPNDYSNPWISLKELRVQLLRTYEHYLETQNFGIDLQLVQNFTPLFSQERTLLLTAKAYQAWGRCLLERAKQSPPDKVAAMERNGRAQYRRAGRVYARLAKIRIATPKYPNDLWESATSYLDGQDYRNGIRLLQVYLKNESRRKHASALVRLGEAMLATGRMDKAVEVLAECVEFYPKSVAAFRARLVKSRVCVEKGDLDKAEALLKENLNGDLLTPASQEWKESLFALGELLYVSGDYENSIRRLEEAVTRYPDSPRTLEARLLVASAYRQSANVAAKKLQGELVEKMRVVQLKKVRTLLELSLERYRKVRKLLAMRQEEVELDELERAVLRNCYFAIADILFDQEKFHEAIIAYSTVTNRYQDRPEVLQAYLQIAYCYRRLGQDGEYRGTLKQAKLVLTRLPDNTVFNETTDYTRKQWGDLFGQLSTM